jgi:hypothetical protein
MAAVLTATHVRQTDGEKSFYEIFKKLDSYLAGLYDLTPLVITVNT